MLTGVIIRLSRNSTFSLAKRICRIVRNGPVAIRASGRRHSLELERVGVEMERRAVALAHVQRHVFGVEAFRHGARRLVHQLLRQPEASVRPLHRLKIVTDQLLRALRGVFLSCLKKNG